jgi:hypothetical protein
MESTLDDENEIMNRSKSAIEQQNVLISFTMEELEVYTANKITELENKITPDEKPESVS